MKIGIDIRPIGKKRTGDEVYFFNLVKNLAESDKENEYLLFTDRDPEKDADLSKSAKIFGLATNFRIVFIDSPNRFFWNLWALPRNLRNNPVDIFHTQYIAPFWLPGNVRLVLTIHDISFNFFPEHIKVADLFFLKTLIPRSIHRADKIITVSQNERRNILDFYKISAQKIDFIYNGVEIEKFGRAYSKEEKQKIRERYGLPERFLLYVGTLQPRKNIPSLMVMMNAYKKKYPLENIKLVIVGNRKARNFDKKIDVATEKHGLEKDVVFPGWVEDEDLPAIYKMADSFVFPSLYEGFGIPIVEAMAAGLPVVSSNKSCLPEVGGNGAFFADPDDPNEFAEFVHRAVSDQQLRSKISEKALNRARFFSWKKTAEKTLEIYRNLENRK